MKWFHTRNSSARRFRTPRLATDPPRLSEAQRLALQCRIDQLSHDPSGGVGVSFNYVPWF